MKNATLLVLLGKAARPVDLEQISETARENNLHLIVRILGVMPAIPLYSYGMMEYGAYSLPAEWQADVDAANSELSTLRTLISDYLADQGASAEVRVTSGEAASLPDAVARAALTCDAIIIGDDLRDDRRVFDDIVRAALVRTPAGVMLNSMTSIKPLRPKSVFVAWKAGLPAARAVRAATPILLSADSVTIALFDPVTTQFRDGENPGSDVASWLTHRGCNVSVQQYPGGEEEIGKVILKRAKELGADLIVMGAYDHSRLHEIVFGGTTSSLIDQTDCPVLLSH
jgi:nucleotide-binding universal stress UspA family protein